MYYGCIGICALHLNCNTSQYIIEVLGCIERCIVLYSQMYWDVFSEYEQDGNTSQYIVKYISIHHRIHHNTSKIHPKYIHDVLGC